MYKLKETYIYIAELNVNGHSVNFCSHLFNFVFQTVTYWPGSSIICCCSVAQSCLTLCNSMDCSTSGFTVLHYLLEFAQTHVLWVSDAIQPSHLLLSPSAPALNLSHQQGLFQWGSSLHQVAKILELQNNPSNEYSRLISFGLTGLISLLSRELSRVFSSTTVWKHQFFGAQPSLWSNSHFHAWLLEKP